MKTAEKTTFRRTKNDKEGAIDLQDSEGRGDFQGYVMKNNNY